MNKTSFIKKTKIKGLLIIERPKYLDNRGFFHEIFRLDELQKITGHKFNVVQWSHSLSKPGVIRAIHTEQWNKLVYPIKGFLYAPIVDLRPDSSTFGKVEVIEIDNTRKNSSHAAIFISKGLGNSICVLGKEDLHYLYLVDEYWDNSKAQGLAWDDKDLQIKWPLKNPIVSERDKKNPTLRELFPDKFKISKK